MDFDVHHEAPRVEPYDLDLRRLDLQVAGQVSPEVVLLGRVWWRRIHVRVRLVAWTTTFYTR